MAQLAELSFDLSRLFFGQAALSSLAAFSSAPPWNIPVALYGLATVHSALDGPNGGDAGQTLVAVLGGSMFLDVLWFFSKSMSGLARLLFFLNWLLKPITIMALLSHLRSRGVEPSFPGAGGAGFGLPEGLADRLPGGFPPAFGGQQRGGQSETVWAAPTPTHPASSYQGQPRFSLDDPDVEAGLAAAGPRNAAAPPPPPQHKPVAEGGGYHALE
ncbi:hypothetical protein JCM10213_008870 [Rhodosporidiobolus nylandii]